MRQRYSALFNLVVFTAIFLLYLFALASAEESLQFETTRIEPDHTERAPRIESDPARNAFIFIIDGDEVALLDKTGLYIPGSITFGGTMTDAGREWVGDYIAGSDTNEGGSDEE